MQLKQYATKILGLIDLTSLNDSDNEANIHDLCKKVNTSYGSVPAICIYSRFVPFAKNLLSKINPQVKIATVTNFPHGSSDVELALYETKLAIERGANEVDIVLPYHDLIAGDEQIAYTLVNKAKKICSNKILKVIIESGELKTPELIKKASEISIEAGADFIKTSTGKVAINATLEAAEIMLNVISDKNKHCGFKAAGGIRSVTEAIAYLDLATKIMGSNWIEARTFRFGASGLLGNVLDTLADQETTINTSTY